MPQQSHRGSTGRTTPAARRARGTATAVGLALLLLSTACGGGGGGDEEKAGAKTSPTQVAATVAGVVAPAKVEVIADLTGCKVKIRTEADELREGVCHTDKGDYLITTFPEEKFKLTWLDAAAVYGGKYLVGTRWVVSAKKPALLEKLRPQLGGTIQQLRGVGPTAS